MAERSEHIHAQPAPTRYEGVWAGGGYVRNRGRTVLGAGFRPGTGRPSCLVRRPVIWGRFPMWRLMADKDG